MGGGDPLSSQVSLSNSFCTFLGVGDPGSRGGARATREADTFAEGKYS